MNRLLIAQAAHAINRGYCLSLGDESVPLWADTDDAHKESLLAGVDMFLADPDATPENAHESWLAAKLAGGWVYGEVKDIEAKIHPCCVPYSELPAEQRAEWLVEAPITPQNASQRATESNARSIEHMAAEIAKAVAAVGAREDRTQKQSTK